MHDIPLFLQFATCVLEEDELMESFAIFTLTVESAIVVFQLPRFQMTTMMKR